MYTYIHTYIQHMLMHIHINRHTLIHTVSRAPINRDVMVDVEKDRGMYGRRWKDPRL